ncbi:hypothetical protein E2320_015541, partial [Naja naja]
LRQKKILISQTSVSKQKRRPWSPGAAPLEHGERLQFNPFYPPKAPSLPPHLSAPLLHLQEEPHSCGDWLALQLRGKTRGKSWGNGRSVPLPSQPGCLRSLLFPFVGAEPDVFSLAWQSWLRKHHHQVSVQEPCGEGYRRLRPPPPLVHLQATVCAARELGEREKERHREKDREEKEGEREMKEKGRKMKKREKEKGRKREKGREIERGGDE